MSPGRTRSSPKKATKTSKGKGGNEKNLSILSYFKKSVDDEIVKDTSTGETAAEENDSNEQIDQLLAEKENPVAIVPETDPLAVQEDRNVEKKKGKKEGVKKKDLKKKKQVQVDPNIAKVSDNKFSCTLCNRDFTRMTGLNHHIKAAHTMERDKECEWCFQGFVTSAQLNKHKKKAVMCKICDEPVCGIDNLKRHENEHANMSFKCFHCPELFYLRLDLRKHEASHATEDDKKVHACTDPDCNQLYETPTSANSCESIHQGKHECNTCHGRFRTVAELTRHEETHKESKGIVCAICNQTYKNETYLMTHIKNYHESPKDAVKCEKCGKGYRSKVLLGQHMRTTHGDLIYNCNQCPRRFPVLSRLTAHYRNVHLPAVKNVQPVKCNICEQEFKSKSNLRGHMKVHTGERPHTCSECGEKFARPWSLKMHVKAVHSDNRDIPCDECPNRFVSNSALNVHKKNVHTDKSLKETYLCPHEGCDYVAHARNHLEAHIKSVKHLGIREFACDECDLVFTRKWTLIQHTNIMHRDIRKEYTFKCMKCGRGFLFHKAWLEHIELDHFLECDLCDMKFNSGRTMHKHRREVHLKANTELPRCELCHKRVNSESMELHKHRIHGEPLPTNMVEQKRKAPSPNPEEKSPKKSRKKKKSSKKEEWSSEIEEGMVGTFEENNDETEVVFKKKPRQTKLTEVFIKTT